MPIPLDQKLRTKGWSEGEINDALQTLYSPSQQQKQSFYRESASPLLYWAGLIVLIIGNLFFALILVPVLMVLTKVQLFIVVSIMGLTFGLMFDFLLRDIEHVDQQHHIIAGLFIPAIALITVFVMVNLANAFSNRLNFGIIQSPLLVSLFYVGAFVLPYASMKIRERLMTH